ncbi:hypothetical protein SDC9_190900 [bioreactor metagenome]|uniref:Uncharacterized protein n=1 Tax=bioreactor metagenome TaxID=1076179 RepID=A0A645HWB1_9ZZZZ
MRKLSSLKSKWKLCFFRYMTARTALRPWESIVASAAPGAPILKTATRIRSPITLQTEAMATKTSGLFESPNPLSIALRALYANINEMPAELMKRYPSVWETASVGVCIILTRGFTAANIINVRATLTIAKRVNIVPIVSLMSLSDLAPKYLAIRIVPPIERPIIMPLMRNMNWLPIAAAESPAALVK